MANTSVAVSGIQGLTGITLEQLESKTDKVIPSTVNNLAALDAVGNLSDSGISETELISSMIINGVAVDYDFSILSGPADQPTEVLFTNVNIVYKLNLTWGTTGGEAGNELEYLVSKSTDTGTTFLLIKTLSLAYDANSNLITQTWS